MVLAVGGAIGAVFRLPYSRRLNPGALSGGRSAALAARSLGNRCKRATWRTQVAGRARQELAPLCNGRGVFSATGGDLRLGMV